MSRRVSEQRPSDVLGALPRRAAPPQRSAKRRRADDQGLASAGSTAAEPRRPRTTRKRAGDTRRRAANANARAGARHRAATRRHRPAPTAAAPARPARRRPDHPSGRPADQPTGGTSSAQPSRPRPSWPRSACRSAPAPCASRSPGCRVPEPALRCRAPRRRTLVRMPRRSRRAIVRPRAIGGGTTCGSTDPQGRIGPAEDRSATRREPVSSPRRRTRKRKDQLARESSRQSLCRRSA